MKMTRLSRKSQISPWMVNMICPVRVKRQIPQVLKMNPLKPKQKGYSVLVNIMNSKLHDLKILLPLPFSIWKKQWGKTQIMTDGEITYMYRLNATWFVSCITPLMIQQGVIICSFLYNYISLHIFGLIHSIPLSSNYNLRAEPKHIVFLSKLLLLFQLCHFCRTENKPKVTATENGTEVVIKAECTNPSCRKEFTWYSQPIMPGTKTAAGNFLLCMATLFSGGSFSRVAQIFQHMGLSCISLNTFLCLCL